MSNNTVLIVGAVIVIILLYFALTPSSSSESFTPNTVVPNSAVAYIDEGIITDDAGDIAVDDFNDVDDNEETRRIKRKFITRDTTYPGKYKQVSYAKGVRGGLQAEPALDRYFQDSNDLIQSDIVEDNEFSGYNDAQGDDYAPYSSDKKKVDKYRLKEIFNSDGLLPQKTRDDWFEVLPDAINVKDRHLINVSKPIGINTIGTSLRNASWDIRGSPPCPKFVVSPWMQSTIDQDNNLKSLC